MGRDRADLGFCEIKLDDERAEDNIAKKNSCREDAKMRREDGMMKEER